MPVIDIFDTYQAIWGDLGEGLHISGEFRSGSNSGQATECVDYTRLFHGGGCRGLGGLYLESLAYQHLGNAELVSLHPSE